MHSLSTLTGPNQSILLFGFKLLCLWYWMNNKNIDKSFKFVSCSKKDTQNRKEMAEIFWTQREERMFGKFGTHRVYWRQKRQGKIATWWVYRCWYWEGCQKDKHYCELQEIGGWRRATIAHTLKKRFSLNIIYTLLLDGFFFPFFFINLILLLEK